MKTKIVQFRKSLSLLVIMLTVFMVNAQNNITMTIENDVQIDSKTMRFDVYLKNADPVNPMELSTIQFGITVNTAGIKSTGTLSYTTDSAYSEFKTIQKPVNSNFAFTQSNGVKMTARGMGPGAGYGTLISRTGLGTRVCRVFITNTVDFTRNSKANLAFSFVANPNITKCNQYVGGVSKANVVNATNCTSNATNIYLNEVVPPTGDAAQSFCLINAPTVASLTTTTGSGIKWYSASSGGTFLATTVALVNNTQYFATQTVGGYESPRRLEVTATVANPAAPTGDAVQSFNLGATVGDLIVATGTDIKWYNALGDLLSSGTTLVDGVHYFASQTVGGCEGISRFEVTVTINSVCVPGLYTFSGTGNWSEGARWDSGIPAGSCNDVIINGNVTVGANVGCGKLTINAGKSVTVSSGKTLDVSDSLILKSDGTNGNAALVDKGTVNYDPNKTLMQLYITGNATRDTMYHYFSSPVNASTVNVFMHFFLYKFNEPTNSWLYEVINGTMENAKGYAGFNTAVISPTPNITAAFTGTFNTGNKSANLTKTDYSSVEANDNWNLIGNPYPSPVDLDLLSLNNVEPTVYFWNGTANIHTGTYASYNINTHVTSNGGQNVLPAGQGLFVHASGTSASVGFTNNARIPSTQPFYKDNTINPNHLRLSVEGNQFRDEAVVGFIQGATSEYDGMFDAYKMTGYDLVPALYSRTSNGTKLAVNEYPVLEQGQTVVVPLDFTIGANGTFNLSATDLNTFDNDISVFLEDLTTQEMINLKNINTYNFSFVVGALAHRFNVHFKREPNSIDELASNTNVYSYNNTIYVTSNNIMNANVFVYDVLGQEISKTLMEGKSSYRINANGLSKGYYFVKVISDNKSITKKVYID